MNLYIICKEIKSIYKKHLKTSKMALSRNMRNLVDDFSTKRTQIKNRDGGKQNIGCLIQVKGQKCVLCDWLQPI